MQVEVRLKWGAKGKAYPATLKKMNFNMPPNRFAAQTRAHSGAAWGAYRGHGGGHGGVSGLNTVDGAAGFSAPGGGGGGGGWGDGIGGKGGAADVTLLLDSDDDNEGRVVPVAPTAAAAAAWTRRMISVTVMVDLTDALPDHDVVVTTYESLRDHAGLYKVREGV